MAFDRITDGDLLGKGNLGRPDTPGVDTAEMQRILDELPREVIVPAFNRLADQLETSNAAASLGAVPPESLPEDTPATVQGVLEGDTLTLWVDTDFTKSMVGTPPVLKALAELASTQTGREVRCAVKVGKAPAEQAASQQKHDNLDDLLALGRQFDNIIIEE